MCRGVQQFSELAGAFESVAEATEHLLGEYALFVLEHEEVVTFLQDYLRTLRYNFDLALYSFDAEQAQKLLEDLQVLFGEAQLEVNRNVVPSFEQVSSATLSRTNV